MVSRRARGGLVPPSRSRARPPRVGATRRWLDRGSSRERPESTVIGDPVNRAAKLEKHYEREAATAAVELEALRLAEVRGTLFAGYRTLRSGCRPAGRYRPVDLAVLTGEGRCSKASP